MRPAVTITAIALAILLGCGGAYAQSGGGAKFKSEKEKTSYAVGMSIGQNLKRQGIQVDMTPLMRGISAVVNNKRPRMSPQEFQATMRELGQRLKAGRQQAQQSQGKKNASQGAAFLKQNRNRKGVQALPSGLQYRVLRRGKGRKPKATDTVVTHYKGTLIDGTVFDSSYTRGKPAAFPVKGVIRGWTEALQLMPVGSKWELVIPPQLAYGNRGSGKKIGPNATLIFEIELLDIR